MFIKNNSNHEWKDYNCGDGVVITVKPKSTFEVPEAAGEVLLKNLGHEKWLVKVEKSETKKEEPTVKESAEKTSKDFDRVLSELGKEEEPKKRK